MTVLRKIFLVSIYPISARRRNIPSASSVQILQRGKIVAIETQLTAVASTRTPYLNRVFIITGALFADGPVPGKMVWIFDGANTKLAAALTGIDGRDRKSVV